MFLILMTVCRYDEIRSFWGITTTFLVITRDWADISSTQRQLCCNLPWLFSVCQELLAINGNSLHLATRWRVCAILNTVHVAHPRGGTCTKSFLCHGCRVCKVCRDRPCVCATDHVWIAYVEHMQYDVSDTRSIWDRPIDAMTHSPMDHSKILMIHLTVR